jgi:3-deoxy-D-manno-octulosonic-acid transferase
VRALQQALDLSGEVPVLVGGSLRRQECIALLEVFRTLRKIDSNLVGIFAPRHLTQIPNMIGWLNDQKTAFQLFSEIETAREKRASSLILVDRIGLLFDLYGLGDLIFCGGTLEPVGGHNIVEPAAWGKPVFYGPHLQKVSDEHNILKSFEGSFVVQDVSDLVQQWTYWIRHLSELRPYGENAHAALSQLGGVSAKQVEIILSALSERALLVNK